MASAQVLPNSAVSARKQEHLEAGKRRLEEFRRKKAAERAKKAASATHVHAANVDQHDEEPVENQYARISASNGLGISDGASEAVVKLSRVFIDNENSIIGFGKNIERGSADKSANLPFPTNYYSSAETKQKPGKDQEFDWSNVEHSSGTVKLTRHPQSQDRTDDHNISSRVSGRDVNGIATDQSAAFCHQETLAIEGSSGQLGNHELRNSHLTDNCSLLKDFTAANPATSHATVANISSDKSGIVLSDNKFVYARPLANSLISQPHEGSVVVGQSTHAVPEAINVMISDKGERKGSNSFAQFPGRNNTSFWPSASQSTDFSSDVRSSSSDSLYPDVAETNSQRSHPSFLDSINVPRVPLSEPGMAESFSSKVHEMDVVAVSSSVNLSAGTENVQPFLKWSGPKEASKFEHSVASVSSGNLDAYRHNVDENGRERKHETYSQKQDEEFAALEQHIEDLTREKFSLQRALEAARSLAESLAAENSSLTDSYNQQGSVVNQLKFDMERLQAEIKGQLAELESVKVEYANAQLECNAADERAKLLASEVIGLEEKALRLRSSELKLERQLENSEAEISLFKKKLSSLGKERQDLQSTVDALKEEKKLLETKLRKASTRGKIADFSYGLTSKKDASTSTNDLIDEDNSYSGADMSHLEIQSGDPVAGSDASGASCLAENRQFNLEVSMSNIPPDQMRMIQNINNLIAELSLEKEEMMQALLAESSETNRLKELNKELLRKLEAQTQRLELLTAQSMANENIPAIPSDSRDTKDNIAYADEGDEVVERVLGWIMKFFPGGPSRRRTSKLL